MSGEPWPLSQFLISLAFGGFLILRGNEIEYRGHIDVGDTIGVSWAGIKGRWADIIVDFWWAPLFAIVSVSTIGEFKIDVMAISIAFVVAVIFHSLGKNFKPLSKLRIKALYKVSVLLGNFIISLGLVQTFPWINSLETILRKFGG